MILPTFPVPPLGKVPYNLPSAPLINPARGVGEDFGANCFKCSNVVPSEFIENTTPLWFDPPLVVVPTSSCMFPASVTTNFCLTAVAGSKLALPGCDATISATPLPTIVTRRPSILTTPAVGVVKVTGKFDVELAEIRKGASPNFFPSNGKKVIV